MITQPVHDEITSQARQQFAKDFCILTSRIDWLALMSSFIPKFYRQIEWKAIQQHWHWKQS